MLQPFCERQRPGQQGKGCECRLADRTLRTDTTTTRHRCNKAPLHGQKKQKPRSRAQRHNHRIAGAPGNARYLRTAAGLCIRAHTGRAFDARGPLNARRLLRVALNHTFGAQRTLFGASCDFVMKDLRLCYQKPHFTRFQRTFIRYCSSSLVGKAFECYADGLRIEPGSLHFCFLNFLSSLFFC